MNKPLNLKEGNPIKAGLHIGLHLIDVCGFWAAPVAKFCGPPVATSIEAQEIVRTAGPVT